MSHEYGSLKNSPYLSILNDSFIWNKKKEKLKIKRLNIKIKTKSKDPKTMTWAKSTCLSHWKSIFPFKLKKIKQFYLKLDFKSNSFQKLYKIILNFTDFDIYLNILLFVVLLS